MADGLERDAELLALHQLDEKSVRLQKEGRYLEALKCLERGLVLRQHFFGVNSDEVWQACKIVGELCNLLAMMYLQQGDFKMTEKLLKKAEILHQNDDAGRAVTNNNLACYHRRRGKLNLALKCLKKTLRLEANLPDVKHPGDTHLNVCAVLSQLGRHSQALEHAQAALILLQEELFDPAQHEEDGGGISPDRIAVLCIAYHNIGAENEFLKQWAMAVESYKKGSELADAHLGDAHGITATLRNSFLSAKQALAKHNGVKLPPLFSKRRSNKQKKKSPSGGAGYCLLYTSPSPRDRG